MEFWQRPFAYSGEEIDGHVVGSVNRNQSSTAARTARRALRGQWMEGAMAAAYVGGMRGLTWSEFQADLQRRIVSDSASVPNASTASSSSSAVLELGSSVPKTPPLKRRRDEEEDEEEQFVLMATTAKAAPAAPKVQQKSMPFVQRIVYRPAPKVQPKAMPKVVLPPAVPTQRQARPTQIEVKAMPMIAAVDSRAAAKARATRFLMRVEKPPVEDVVEDQPAPEPEFFQPGSLMRLLDPPRDVVIENLDEDDDDSWGADWPSPSA